MTPRSHIARGNEQKGNSLIADPNGKILAGPLNAKEGILLAKIDLHMLRALK